MVRMSVSHCIKDLLNAEVSHNALCWWTSYTSGVSLCISVYCTHILATIIYIVWMQACSTPPLPTPPPFSGIQHVAPFENFPTDKWDDILAVNLSAAFHTSRLAVTGMKERGWYSWLAHPPHHYAFTDLSRLGQLSTVWCASVRTCMCVRIWTLQSLTYWTSTYLTRLGQDHQHSIRSRPCGFGQQISLCVCQIWPRRTNKGWYLQLLCSVM